MKQERVHRLVLVSAFKKTFDQIDHFVLISKMDCRCFSQDLLNLFKSYLSDRHQSVEYIGVKSYTGVPQGPNLGRLLYLIMH